MGGRFELELEASAVIYATFWWGAGWQKSRVQLAGVLRSDSQFGSSVAVVSSAAICLRQIVKDSGPSSKICLSMRSHFI